MDTGVAWTKYISINFHFIWIHWIGFLEKLEACPRMFLFFDLILYGLWEGPHAWGLWEGPHASIHPSIERPHPSIHWKAFVYTTWYTLECQKSPILMHTSIHHPWILESIHPFPSPSIHVSNPLIKGQRLRRYRVIDLPKLIESKEQTTIIVLWIKKHAALKWSNAPASWDTASTQNNRAKELRL